ncbi:MAG: PQQ-binding-like beta-propeller repeat protein [Solirubrobacteraceae bacterium]
MSDGTPVVADGRVYAGSQTADLTVAYDVDDGRRLWTSPRQLGGWQDGTPTADAGRVFIGSGNGLVARDGATGQVPWVHRSPGTSYLRQNATPSTAAAAGGVVYMGFPDGNVTALDAATGQVVWNRSLPGRPDFGGVHSSPAVSGDVVYVGSNNGSYYALDRVSGEIEWEREIGTWVGAGPAISGNALVFGAWDGNLYTFAERE